MSSALPTKKITIANPKRVFISYRTKEPDLGLAQEFYKALQAVGHHETYKELTRWFNN